MMLFAFFGLWTTTLAAGIGAVSVPIIIHLLNRRRFKIVIWAAMRFLLAAQKQNTRRIRLEQLILLLVRTAIVALIVFAMASVMPWMETVWAAVWPAGAGASHSRGARTHHVIVLDGSLSLTLKDGGQILFDRARQQALDIVKDAPSGDGFSVLLMKDAPTWIVAAASADGRRVEREIESLKAAHGNASVPSMLNMVASKLAECAGRFPIQNVYFLTDLQSATWAGLSPAFRKAGPDDRKGGPDDSPPLAKGGLGGGSEGKDRTPWSDIQSRARTVFIDLGRDDVANLAVTDLTLDAPFVTTGAPVVVKATVQNFGQKAQVRRVELLQGKARENASDPVYSPRVIGQEIIEVRPADRMSLQFLMKFPSPGTYALTVKLEPDALELDDRRTIIVTVKDTIPILLVNGKPAGDRYERATEYLRLALQPFPTGAEPKFAPLRPKVISHGQFIDIPDTELAEYDCIFLCDVPSFGVGELRRFESQLRRGGGLVFAMGDRAADNLEVYNRLLFKSEQGLLPAQLVKKVTAPANHVFNLLAQESEFREAPLKAFADEDDKLAFRSARFRQFIEAKPAGDAKARTILSFMPQLEPDAKGPLDKALSPAEPALMEWNPPLPRDPGAPRGKDGKLSGAAPTRYRGKVVLFTSTFNMDWNSWPGSPSFGAMMQEVARLAVSGRLRDQAHVVGDALEETFAGGSEVDAAVMHPAAVSPTKVRTTLVEDVNIFRWTDTDLSGLYVVTMTGSPREHLFAVNVPSTTPDQRGSESNLTRVDKARLQELYPGWDIQVVTDPRLARFAEGPLSDDAEPERIPVGPDIARVALLLVFLLVLAEVVLAWKFGHYSTVEGASAPAAVGRAWPVAIAVCAGIAFLLGAFVLIDAHRTGDFLGFLPDGMRGWMEGLLGVPPASAGEGTRWDLEHFRFLPNIADETWLAAFLALAALALVFFTYRAEAPTVSAAYRGLLGGLRVVLILLTLAVLLPQIQIRFDRQGWPDVVLLIDDSRSMGEPDNFQSEATRDRAKKLADGIRKKLQDTLPEKIKSLEAELAGKAGAKDSASAQELEQLLTRLKVWQTQLAQVNSASWRPTRLQLAQEILADPEREWLGHLINRRHFKVHVYHLDAQGRAIRLTDADGPAGELTEADPIQLERAQKAVAGLEAEANDSRLGTSLRQVIDQYRGSSLAAVVMFTDGVTTRDETIAQVGEYAAQKAVPLYFVGIGEDNEVRDLRLHDLQVEDTVYVGDRIVFKAYITGQGYKTLQVPVILKIKEKDGLEKEVDRTVVKVDPNGKSEKLQLLHTPVEVGRKTYVIQVEVPKSERPEKGPNPTNLRLERTIDVIDTKLIKVLYVEGQPRYEFRFLKSLLEREGPDAKKNKSMDLKVLLLDGDADFAATDKSALAHFPPTREELEQYDVIILGDCNPRHPKLGSQKLQMIADFVRGGDPKDKRTSRTGGGLLVIGGPFFSPHAYKGTPLADVLPIEPTAAKAPLEPEARSERLRLELTPIGRLHPIFRFAPDDAENLAMWQRLAPMYWHSIGYRTKPLAEVLAVHPSQKAEFRDPNQDGRHPLIVQQFVGSGRSLFFGIDETWRWRFRENEFLFNRFWVQTMRYLSRTRLTKTDLRLDRQTPYRLGEPIKVLVRFPDNNPLPGEADKGPKADVKVVIEYTPKLPKDAPPVQPEVQTMTLQNLEGNRWTYDGILSRTREGKYRFWLSQPDVTKTQPDGQKPSAEATVELPPGEMDRLRMNQPEMISSAEASQGRFYTLANAQDALDDLPTGFRVSLSTPRPPLRLWNTWYIFLLVLGLLTAEWLLRKRKHLL